MRTPHTICARGKVVRVVLRNGETFEARFLERTPGKRLKFEGYEVAVGDVRQFITSPKIRRARKDS